MTTQITEQQYDVAALSLAVKVREFVYKHGTRFSYGAVDALACIFDSDDARYGGSGHVRQHRLTTDAHPTHGFPFRLRLGLPPLGAVFFRLDR